MATQTWPTSLPARAIIDGYEDAAPVSAIRTEMDAGPAKLRRRYTAAPYRVGAALMLRSDDQKAALLDFFTNVLQGGVLPFTWKDSAGTPVTYRFIADDPGCLRFQPFGGGVWRASMALEVLP